MPLDFRFAIISDPHIALPTTIWDNPYRFHMVEVSIPALEVVLAELAQIDLDFLLLPGDLTQHGEPENHAWLAERLAQLPYPVYVVPGNHDVPAAIASLSPDSNRQTIGLSDFPQYYQKFGYEDPSRPYYTCEVLPGVRLIGLNSNDFDETGTQLPYGRLDAAQLQWLAEVLETCQDELVLVMVHHNVLEHLPGQTSHSMGRRYMLENAPDLLRLLRQAGVQLLFTGHLHVQDIAQQDGLYEVTTGSLVSYPHPYRLLHYRSDRSGTAQLYIESERVSAVEGWEDLSLRSREWMGDRSFSFMLKLLTLPPLNLPVELATQLVPDLRYFWADIAQGDALFDFAHFPAEARRYLYQFSALNVHGEYAPIDNRSVLNLGVRQGAFGIR